MSKKENDMTIYSITDDNIDLVHQAEAEMEVALDNWDTPDMNVHLLAAADLFEQAGLLDSAEEARGLAD